MSLESKVVDFEFQRRKVRSVMIGGYVWFVARDVFTQLEMSWNIQRLDSIPTEWKRRYKIVLAFRNSSQKQDTWLINEQAFYRIVGNSNHPDAIEFSNKAAQFMKDLREGKVGDKELALMRDAVQQLYFEFFDVQEQRTVNHTRNNTVGLRSPLGRYWRELYQTITGKGFEDVMSDLKKKGVPDWVLKNSGQDGLRFFADNYGKAIAFSAANQLTLDGYNKEKVEDVIKLGMPFLEQLGKLVGADNCLSKGYKPRPKKEKNLDQMELGLCTTPNAQSKKTEKS